jgi:toxin-antitoxin system PIN domain toxin
VIVDANVLLYARNEDDERHGAARDWLEGALNGETRVGLPWASLGAFHRIATNPRAYPEPLTHDEAWAQVEAWLDAPRAWVPQPTDRYRAVLGRLVRQHRVTGPLYSDAALAALAIDHGVPVVSTDADFARFDGLTWTNPLTDD